MKLEVTNLTCGYNPEHPVLSNVSFSLQGGDICCFLGQNGVGKSTLFRTLLKLNKPIAGEVRINGEDIKGWGPKRMASVVAYVAQSHTPTFPYLVREMVMLGRLGKIGTFAQPSKEDEAIVDSILSDMGIDFLKDMPYTEISGGERQLVMMARALAQEPELLVLDEPAANLDFGNKILIMDKIRWLAGTGICVIFTTHDPEHALLLDAQTMMLFRNDPYIFGPAATIITEKSLKKAYNANIRVVEVVDESGRPVRVCIPRLQSINESLARS